jgi:putative glutamine amidotransferase
MKQPTIGLSIYANENKDHHFLPTSYVHAIKRAGGVPYLIPPVGFCPPYPFDGLLLAGGGDIHPDHYQGDWHDSLYLIDEDRDKTEFALAGYALENNIPTLGICRGMQVLNLAAGGNLYEHIEDQLEDLIEHRTKEGHRILHEVEIERNSRLGNILEVERCEIASKHHQALKNIAKPFQVCARAADGVVEGIESREHDFMLGLQWHPEMTAETDPLQQKIFNEFIETIKQGK